MSNDTFEDIKKEVIIILENNGIVAEMEDDGDTFLDILTIDSITFISFIVDVEAKFEIIFPDEFLSINILQSLNGFVHLLCELLDKRLKLYVV